MLYAMQDATARALAPLATFCDIGTWFCRTPMAAFFPLLRDTEATLRLTKRLVKSYAKPAFDIDTVMVGGKPVAVCEEIVETLPFCVLRHFAKGTAKRGPRLLIVAPLSGHHSTLLRGTVQALLEQHDVYITDWTDARQVPLSDGKFDLSDYTRYVQRFIRLLGPEVHVLAVCQPTVATLAAVSLMEQNNEAFVPKSLTLISGPVDVRSNPTAVNRFASKHDMSFFEGNLIEPVPYGYPGVRRKVYPGFKQLSGFVLMNKDRHTQAYADYYADVRDGHKEKAARHEEFYDEYNAVLDMPAEYYLETIAKVFLKPQLALGELELCGQTVQPAAIRRTALLTVEGAKDDICGQGQTHAAQALCSSLLRTKRKTFTVADVGHFGSFSGSTFRSTTVPVIAEFIRKHN